MSRMMHMFRKYQYMLLIVFGVLLMFVFVIGDALMGLMGPGQGGGQPDEVVLTWKHGTVRGNDLYSQRVRHNMAVEFLSEIVQETVRREGTPKGLGVFRDQFGRYNPGITIAENDEMLVQKMLLAAKAESLGVKVDNDAVKAFLHQLSDGELNDNDLGIVYNKTIAGRMTQQHLMDQLQHELLAQQMWMMTRAGFVVPPREAWGFHNRMRRRVQTEMVALKVDSFKDRVSKMPTEDEIRKLYEEGKDRFPNPYSPEVAFRRRHKLAFEYVRADSGKLQEEEAAKIKETITDEEIEKYYEENKARYRVIELPTDDSPSASDAADSNPDAAPESDEKPVPEETSDKDAASESPDREEPSPEKPAPSEPDPAPAANPPVGDQPAASEEENCDVQDLTETEAAEPAATPAPPAATEAAPDVTPETAPTPEAAPATDNPPAAPDAAPADAEKPAPVAEAPAPASEPAVPATETPSADAVPATEKQPEEPKYKPLDDKLRAEIREELATDRSRQPAQERLNKALDEIKSEIDNYGRQVRRIDVAKSGEKPKPVNYEKLAAERGFTAGKIDATDVLGIEEYELGQAYEMTFTSWPPQRVSFAQKAFLDTAQPYRAQRIKSAELDVEFLYWNVAEEEAYVPELEDIRDEVIDAWKRREAFVIAKAEAEKLAKQAAGDKPLGESLSTHDDLEIIQPAPFSWMSTGSTPFGGAGAPTLSQVEGVEAAGNEFMRSVFSLKKSEVGIAVDQPEAIVYVVRIAAETPSDEMLKEQFLSSGVTPEMSQIAFVEIEDVWQDWYKNLEEEMEVKWNE
ncbi:MAG TPA: hypothetical protein VMM76_04330 [Pirellulaceae bacterium]|nr:hypothetical protein [Pirellulaceae bacterium]